MGGTLPKPCIEGDRVEIGDLALGFLPIGGNIDEITDTYKGHACQVHGLYLLPAKGDQIMSSYYMCPVAISHGEETGGREGRGDDH